MFPLAVQSQGNVAANPFCISIGRQYAPLRGAKGLDSDPYIIYRIHICFEFLDLKANTGIVVYVKLIYVSAYRVSDTNWILADRIICEKRMRLWIT